jgi:hypothetical protein
MPDVPNEKVNLAEMTPEQKRALAKSLLAQRPARNSASKVAALKHAPEVNPAGLPTKELAPLIPPVDPKELQREIGLYEPLVRYGDLRVILTEPHKSPALLREIGRLREIAYRQAGEGRGHESDIDEFDDHYHQVIAWSDAKSAIAGGYRLLFGAEALKLGGPEKLYSALFFEFLPEHIEQVLPYVVETGRFFVPAEFRREVGMWLIWRGLGLSVAASGLTVRYLLGMPSIPQSFPKEAKERIVRFFELWYAPRMPPARPKRPFVGAGESRGASAKEALAELESRLGALGVSLPTQFKLMTGSFEAGGVQFHGFDIDHDFQSVDGLMLCDLELLTPFARSFWM